MTKTSFQENLLTFVIQNDAFVFEISAYKHHQNVLSAVENTTVKDVNLAHVYIEKINGNQHNRIQKRDLYWSKKYVARICEKKKKKMCANMKMYLGACVQIKKSLQDF